MVNKSDSGSSALEASTFGGRMPAGIGRGTSGECGLTGASGEADDFQGASDLAAGPYYQFNPSAPESFSNPLVDNHIFLSTSNKEIATRIEIAQITRMKPTTF